MPATHFTHPSDMHVRKQSKFVLEDGSLTTVLHRYSSIERSSRTSSETPVKDLAQRFEPPATALLSFNIRTAAPNTGT
jgi:hypothetical protein